LLLRLQPASVLVRVAHHGLRGIEPQHVTDGSNGRFHPSGPCLTHQDQEIARMTDADGNIRINRAPVLTLWTAVVAERLGFDRDTALTLGQAVAGLSAYAKGVSLGIITQPWPGLRRRTILPIITAAASAPRAV